MSDQKSAVNRAIEELAESGLGPALIELVESGEPGTLLYPNPKDINEVTALIRLSRAGLIEYDGKVTWMQVTDGARNIEEVICRVLPLGVAVAEALDAPPGSDPSHAGT